MSYYKDPNVEELYTIANKSNVKTPKKIKELLDKFQFIINTHNIDINIPSKRTFTFSDNSHLLNVALNKNNLWLANFILNNYGDNIVFDNSGKYLDFMLLSSKHIEFNNFESWYNKDFNIHMDNYFKDAGFFHEDKSYFLKSQFITHKTNYIQQLFEHSLQNKSPKIFNFLLKEKFKFNPVFINQVQNWYIDHPSGYGLHDKHGYSLINSHSEENIKYLSESFYNDRITAEQLIKITTNNIRKYSFNKLDSNLTNELKRVLDIFPQPEIAQKNIFSFLKDILSHCKYEDINKQELPFLKMVADKYLTEQDILNIFLLDYDEKTLPYYNIKWDTLNYFTKDRNFVPVLKESVLPNIVEKNENKFNLELTDFSYYLMKCFPNLKLEDLGIKLHHIINLADNRHNKNYPIKEDDSILFFLTKVSSLNLEERHSMFLDKFKNRIRFKHYTTTFLQPGLDNYNFLHPYILLFNPNHINIADTLLKDKSQENNYSILEELAIIKTSMKLGNYNLENYDINNTSKYLLEKIDLIINNDEFNSICDNLYNMFKEVEDLKLKDFLSSYSMMLNTILDRYIIKKTINNNDILSNKPTKRL